MDRKLLDDKRVYERNERNKPSNDKDIFKNKGQGSQREKEVIQSQEKELKHLLEVLSRTVDHYFPKFNEWLAELTDLRDQEVIDYDKQTIIWTELLSMLTKRGSRKKITDQMRSKIGCANLKELSGQEDLEKVPHGDTIEYFNLRAKEEEFEELQVKLMRELFRKRVLEKYRLENKYHTISIDGVHQYTFDYEHCEHCLCKTDKKSGRKQWFHYKLQASLVTPTGLCLPMASEWIENEKGYDKQDCEIKAFCRLIKKLRRLYLRLPICILLDGLYAVEPVVKSLKEFSMEWIIVFKEGRSPEAYKWVMELKNEYAKENILKRKKEKVIAVRNRRTHQEKLIRNKPQHQTRTLVKETVYTWMKDVEHWDGRRKFNVITCKEDEDGKTNCNYVWLVSEGLNVCKDNVMELSERGRCRWKIENEGINMLKNGGYRLEHQYSRDPVSMKIWSRIIDMAHLINQLIERGSLISKEVYGSIRNIADRMFEHFRYFIFKKPDTRSKVQIRLCWDTS